MNANVIKNHLQVCGKSPNVCGLYGRPLMDQSQRKVHGDAVPNIELSKEKPPADTQSAGLVRASFPAFPLCLSTIFLALQIE